jgi:hypothetical protein
MVIDPYCAEFGALNGSVVAARRALRVKTTSEPPQSFQSRVDGVQFATPACTQVAVFPARGAESQASFATERSHRDVEEQLFPNEIVEVQDLFGTEHYIELAAIQRTALVSHSLPRERHHVDRAGGRDRQGHRRQAPPALNLDPPPHLALDEVAISLGQDAQANCDRFEETDPIPQRFQEAGIVLIVEE